MTRGLRVHMGHEEQGQLFALLDGLTPRQCLEWGSGGSTRALIEFVPAIERLVSIEHDRDWYERVRSAVTDSRLELHFVPPKQSAPPRGLRRATREAWNARAEFEPDLLADYVARPAALGTRFDFVLVDGRARRFCLEAGWRLLRPGGVLVLHDAQRPDYHDALYSLGTPLLLEPWSYGQLALLTKP